MELPDLGGISESRIAPLVHLCWKTKFQVELGAGAQLSSEKAEVLFGLGGQCSLLTPASLCKVFPAEQQSGKALQRAEGGAGTEQVLASKPGLAAEQTEGGGEGAEGNL